MHYKDIAKGASPLSPKQVTRRTNDAQHSVTASVQEGVTKRNPRTIGTGSKRARPLSTYKCKQALQTNGV